MSRYRTINGNPHLKRAFSEAACLLLRESDQARAWHQKPVSKYGKAKALSFIRRVVDAGVSANARITSRST